MIDFVAPTAFKINLQHGPRRKHGSFIVVVACLLRRSIAAAVIFFVSRSLPSNVFVLLLDEYPIVVK
jgi:hypothetical protein